MTLNTNGLVWLLISVVLISLSSCDPDPIDPPENPIINIEDDFKINFYEELTTEKEDRIFTFTLESLSQFECINYEIAYAVSITGDLTNISINDIKAPNDCEAGTGPALAISPIAHFKKGSHDLKIILKDQVNNIGKVLIDDSSISLEMESTDGLDFENITMQRVPNNIIWGYYSYENDAIDIVQKFQSQFEPYSIDATLPEGYYGQFSIDNTNTISFDMNPSYSTVRPFISQYEDINGDLEAFVNTQTAAIEGFELKVFTSAGKAY